MKIKFLYEVNVYKTLWEFLKEKRNSKIEREWKYLNYIKILCNKLMSTIFSYKF